jgi:hypothetical protein
LMKIDKNKVQSDLIIIFKLIKYLFANWTMINQKEKCFEEILNYIDNMFKKISKKEL